MSTRKLAIVMLISFLFLSACAPGQLAKLGEAAGQAGQPASGQEAEEPGVTGEVAPRLAAGAGNVGSPPVPPVGSGGNVSSPSDQSSGSGGNVSSSGQQTTGIQSGNQAGEAPSFSANAPSNAAVVSQPGKWLTYTDEAHRFSIQYPDSYLILPDVELRSGNVQSGTAAVVRFQDRQLASADTAALEPPKFTVEVFAYPANAPLETFIQSNVKLPGATVERYSNGALSGFRVSTGLMLSPNEFYFFAGPGFIYKLTPQGEHGEQMLQSFRILEP